MNTNMNIIELDTNLDSTAECKKALNESVGKRNWKRLYKLKTTQWGDSLRCFTNENGEFVTITKGGEEGNDCLFVGINVKEKIEAIREIAKFYITHDYGEVYFNPYTNKLFVVGGDGGYGYSKTPIKEEDAEDYFDNYDHHKDFVEFNKHPQTSFITDVEWEAECTPDEEGYMLVGQITLLD